MPKRDGRFRDEPRVFDKTKSPNINLIGRAFGKLTVLGWAGKSEVGTKGQKTDFWVCQCECGDPEYNPISAPTQSLRSGNTKSCGCLSRKHLMSKHPLHLRWCNMIRRCHDPNNPVYNRYGGRGITVCDRWRENFANFYADMGEPPTEKHSLDRINNDLGYSPENCRWATPREQNRNTRANRFLTWNEETKTLADWGEDPRLVALGIDAFLIENRLRLGWNNVETILTTPPILGKMITFQDETLSMMDWSRRMGATTNIVSKRLRHGWTIEQALTIPHKQFRNPRSRKTHAERNRAYRERKKARLLQNCEQG